MELAVVFKPGGDGAEALLLELAQEADRRGWVRPGFDAALLERERTFPTGLATRAGGVAIPHADREWTLRPGVLAAVLERPVLFRNMEDPAREVEVELAFLLVVDRPETQLEVLRQLVDLMQAEELSSFLAEGRRTPGAGRRLEALLKQRLGGRVDG